MAQIVDAEIISQVSPRKGINIIRLFAPSIAGKAQPGQFVHIQIDTNRDFILRRPFSIHRVLTDNTFEILFNTRGRGTAELAERNFKKINLIGPLGHGYWLPEKGNHFLLVAGGIGLASIYFLAEKLLEHHQQFNVLYGVRNSNELIYHLELKRLSHRLTIVTEDGSHGKQGLVTDYLLDEIENYRPDSVFSCGPVGMLKKVAEITGTASVPCQISMEKEMACGIGACLSCVCQSKDINNSDTTKQSRVCLEGPVFEASEIIFD